MMYLLFARITVVLWALGSGQVWNIDVNCCIYDSCLIKYWRPDIKDLTVESSSRTEDQIFLYIDDMMHQCTTIEREVQNFILNGISCTY